MFSKSSKDEGSLEKIETTYRPCERASMNVSGFPLCCNDNVHVTLLFQVPVYEYPKTSIPEYASILVPNVDNTRTDYLIHALAKQSKVNAVIFKEDIHTLVSFDNKYKISSVIAGWALLIKLQKTEWQVAGLIPGAGAILSVFGRYFVRLWCSL